MVPDNVKEQIKIDEDTNVKENKFLCCFSILSGLVFVFALNLIDIGTYTFMLFKIIMAQITE